MHTADRAIKIIKRKHRIGVEEERDTVEPSLKTENEIRREILDTITSWIEDQREAKKELHRQSSFFKQETYESPLFAGLRKAESGPELL
jgi:hypothetical protein